MRGSRVGKEDEGLVRLSTAGLAKLHYAALS
jgi:hypothetical protein